MGQDTTVLIFEWTSKYGPKYRAIALGHSSKGYRDNIIIEKASKDALGKDAWVELRRWATGDGIGQNYGVSDETRFLTALIDGMQNALKARDLIGLTRDYVDRELKASAEREQKLMVKTINLQNERDALATQIESLEASAIEQSERD